MVNDPNDVMLTSAPEFHTAFQEKAISKDVQGFSRYDRLSKDPYQGDQRFGSSSTMAVTSFKEDFSPILFNLQKFKTPKFLLLKKLRVHILFSYKMLTTLFHIDQRYCQNFQIPLFIST